MQKENETVSECSQTKIHSVSLFYTAPSECQRHIKDSSLTKLSSTPLNQKHGAGTDAIKSDRHRWKQSSIRAKNGNIIKAIRIEVV